MSFAKKAYNATLVLRNFHIISVVVANEDPEYSEYVRPRRRRRYFPNPWDDEIIHHQKTWKVKRRTQYRPEGRNAYQITIGCDISLENLKFFELQGIVINEEYDWEKKVNCYKVYGDLKEGFLSFVQILSERYGHQMEFEYI